MSSTTAVDARPRRPRTAWKVWLALTSVAAITWWAGSERYGIDVDVLGFWDNLANGTDKLAQLFQPDFSVFPETVGPMLESLEMAAIATSMGCLVGLPVALLASRVTTPATWLRAPVRAFLSLIRAVPDVIYAVLLVSMIGIGPLGGVLALFWFSVGILVKLLAEVVDAVDTGPYEAAEAAGASRVAAARAAVVPQVLPGFTTFSLYVLELNIRAGTVVGLVGAGGIGELLNIWRKFYRYDDVGLIILEILVVVLLLEAVSTLVRRRLG